MIDMTDDNPEHCPCRGAARWVDAEGNPATWPEGQAKGAHFTNGQRGPAGGYCGACGKRIANFQGGWPPNRP